MVECYGWEECLEALLDTLDQGSLKVKENKSAVGFARKYLASLNPNIADVCMRNIHLADSISTRGLDDRSESLIDILDSPAVHCLNRTGNNQRERVGANLSANLFPAHKSCTGARNHPA